MKKSQEQTEKKVFAGTPLTKHVATCVIKHGAKKTLQYLNEELEQTSELALQLKVELEAS